LWDREKREKVAYASKMVRRKNSYFKPRGGGKNRPPVETSVGKKKKKKGRACGGGGKNTCLSNSLKGEERKGSKLCVE